MNDFLERTSEHLFFLPPFNFHSLLDFISTSVFLIFCPDIQICGTLYAVYRTINSRLTSQPLIENLPKSPMKKDFWYNAQKPSVPQFVVWLMYFLLGVITIAFGFDVPVEVEMSDTREEVGIFLTFTGSYTRCFWFEPTVEIEAGCLGYNISHSGHGVIVEIPANTTECAFTPQIRCNSVVSSGSTRCYNKKFSHMAVCAKPTTRPERSLEGQMYIQRAPTSTIWAVDVILSVTRGLPHAVKLYYIMKTIAALASPFAVLFDLVVIGTSIGKRIKWAISRPLAATKSD